MKKEFLLFSLAAVALWSCDQMDRPATPKPDRTKDVSMTDSSDVQKNAQNPRLNQKNQQDSSWFSDSNTSYDADNTGKNVRDRNSANLTSGDQSETEMDRTITQKVRQILMNDDVLSVNAKNIKIITVDGKVTLRGPVANAREKAEIAKKVHQIEGIKSVENHLEIVKDNS